MKNSLIGGLKSLIPKRDIKDADDILDELEDGEMDQEEEMEEVVKKKSKKVASKKVAIMSEDEGATEPKKEEEVETVEVKKEEVVEEEIVAPTQPKVTPLQIDVDDGEDLSILAEKKKAKKKTVKTVSAKQVSVKTEVKPAPVKVEKAKEPVAKKTVKKVNKVEATVSEETKATPKAKTKTPKKEATDIWNKHEGDIEHALVQDIKINPNQPRRKFDKADMEDLKNSIAQHGILQPLVVRRTKDGYELIAGERRLRAARELEWEKVPCVVRKEVTSGASLLELALIENIQREDLNSVEEALAYKQLNEEYGMTHDEIGERVGRSRVSVTNIIRVLQLPEEIQKGLIDDKITTGHAKAILMIPDSDKQLRFYRHLLEEGLTVRKAETRARRIQRTMRLDDPMRNKRRGRTSFEMKYSAVLEDRYGYDSKLRFDEHKNRYEVMFKCYSKEEIDQLLGRLMGTEVLASDSEDRDIIDDD